MRAVKAKALRRAVGFHPRARRDYDHATPVRKLTIGADGKPQTYVVTGTITATGARRQYQSVKRTPALARAVLGAQA